MRCLNDLLRIKDAAEREKMLEELLGDNEQNRFYIMLQAMALAMTAVNELLLGKQEEMRDILAERLEFRGSDPEKFSAREPISAGLPIRIMSATSSASTMSAALNVRSSVASGSTMRCLLLLARSMICCTKSIVF